MEGVQTSYETQLLGKSVNHENIKIQISECSLAEVCHRLNEPFLSLRSGAVTKALVLRLSSSKMLLQPIPRCKADTSSTALGSPS